VLTSLIPIRLLDRPSQVNSRKLFVWIAGFWHRVNSHKVSVRDPWLSQSLVSKSGGMTSTDERTSVRLVEVSHTQWRGQRTIARGKNPAWGSKLSESNIGKENYGILCDGKVEKMISGCDVVLI
jgi:hypothetical protein